MYFGVSNCLEMTRIRLDVNVPHGRIRISFIFSFVFLSSCFMLFLGFVALFPPFVGICIWIWLNAATVGGGGGNGCPVGLVFVGIWLPTWRFVGMKGVLLI